MPARMSEYLQNRISDRMPYRMLDRLSENMFDKMSDRMSVGGGPLEKVRRCLATNIRM